MLHYFQKSDFEDWWKIHIPTVEVPKYTLRDIEKKRLERVFKSVGSITHLCGESYRRLVETSQLDSDEPARILIQVIEELETIGHAESSASPEKFKRQLILCSRALSHHWFGLWSLPIWISYFIYSGHRSFPNRENRPFQPLTFYDATITSRELFEFLHGEHRENGLVEHAARDFCRERVSKIIEAVFSKNYRIQHSVLYGKLGKPDIVAENHVHELQKNPTSSIIEPLLGLGQWAPENRYPFFAALREKTLDEVGAELDALGL